jgi:myo-inositol-1(or 4)-monophosphatase
MECYEKHLELAIRASQKAGALLLELFPADHDLNSSERLAFVDKVDRKVHRCIYETIILQFPDYGYISVYTKNQTFFKDRPLWVLDPIVGLGNYGHGDPGFAISIALMLEGVTEIAVVYNPVFDQMFTAIRGQGALLNGKSICVSKTERLNEALLSTRFPYDLLDRKVTNLELFNELILKAEGIRNNATATLDLAYVASGQYDGFWAVNMNPWDLTAAVLLIEEAGGKVSTLSNKNYVTESKEILATNGKIHQEIIETIASVPDIRQKINS